MPSFAKCLYDKKFSKLEKQQLITSAKRLIDDGFTDQEAQRLTVKDMINELEAERADIKKQVKAITDKRDRLQKNMWAKPQLSPGLIAIYVDPQKLMADYLVQKDSFAEQIREEIEAHPQDKMTPRTAKVGELANSGKKFQPAMIHSEVRPGFIDFTDGRHRMLFASQMAMTSVPVITSPQSMQTMKKYVVKPDYEKIEPSRKRMSENELRVKRREMLAGKDLFDVMTEVQPKSDLMVPLTRLREAAQSINPAISKGFFDQWVGDLAKADKIWMQKHGTPKLLTNEEKKDLVEYDGEFYVAALRKDVPRYTAKSLGESLQDAEGAIVRLQNYLRINPNWRDIGNELGVKIHRFQSLRPAAERVSRTLKDRIAIAERDRRFDRYADMLAAHATIEHALDFDDAIRSGFKKLNPAMRDARSYSGGALKIGEDHIGPALIGTRFRPFGFAPATSGISLADVQKIFKGQDTGINPDGSIWVRTNKGQGLQIKNVDIIDVDRAAFNMAYGDMNTNGELVVAGKYNEGVIELRKDIGDTMTLGHESYHWFEDVGIVTPNEADVLRRHIIDMHAKGKFDPVNSKDVGGAEDRANFVAWNLSRRKNVESNPVRYVLNKLGALIDRLVNLFTQTAGGIMRDIESGQIFSRPLVQVAGVGPGYQAAAWHGTGAFFKKFMNRFMSSGAGGQMFGWGHYFTTVAGIARHYADMTGDMTVEVKDKKSGKKYFRPDQKDMEREFVFQVEVYEGDKDDVVSHIDHMVEGYEKDVIYTKDSIEQLKKAERKYKAGEELTEAEEFARAVSSMDVELRLLNDTQNMIKEYKVLIRDYQADRLQIIEKPGRFLYKVTLWKGKTEGKDYHLMDWYQPLTMQNKYRVLRGARKFFRENPDKPFLGYRSDEIGSLKELLEDKNFPADAFYDALTNYFGNKEDASMWLLGNGISGIRFPAASGPGVSPQQELGNNIGDLNRREFAAFQARFLRTYKNLRGERLSPQLSGPKFRKWLQKKLKAAGNDPYYLVNPTTMQFMNTANVALEALRLKRTPFNYVVIDPNDVTIEQVEQYQAVPAAPRSFKHKDIAAKYAETFGEGTSFADRIINIVKHVEDGTLFERRDYIAGISLDVLGRSRTGYNEYDYWLENLLKTAGFKIDTDEVGQVTIEPPKKEVSVSPDLAQPGAAMPAPVAPVATKPFKSTEVPAERGAVPGEQYGDLSYADNLDYTQALDRAVIKAFPVKDKKLYPRAVETWLQDYFLGFDPDQVLNEISMLQVDQEALVENLEYMDLPKQLQDVLTKRDITDEKFTAFITKNVLPIANRKLDEAQTKLTRALGKINQKYGLEIGPEGHVRSVQAPAPKPAQMDLFERPQLDPKTRVKNSILAAAHQVAKGKTQLRIRLADLWEALSPTELTVAGGNPLQAFHRELLELQQMHKLVLYHLDDPQDRYERDERVALDILGHKRHIIYVRDYTPLTSLPADQQNLDKPVPQYMAISPQDGEFIKGEKNKAEARRLTRQLSNDSIGAWNWLRDIWRERNKDWEGTRADTSALDRLLSIPLHYFSKVPALKALFDIGQGRQDRKFNIINQLQQDDAGNSMLAEIESFRKTNKAGYKKVKRYLIERDRNQEGYRINRKITKDRGPVWYVYDPRKPFEKTIPGMEFVDTVEETGEAKATKALIQLESSDLIDKGWSGDMVKAVAQFRTITNNGFNVLIRNMRDMAERYKAAGKKVPPVAIFDGADRVKVDINVALAKMGDLRGYYFPRSRQPGRFTLYAEKAGTNPILKHYDLKSTMNLQANRLRKRGYKVKKKTRRYCPRMCLKLPAA